MPKQHEINHPRPSENRQVSRTSKTNCRDLFYKQLEARHERREIRQIKQEESNKFILETLASTAIGFGVAGPIGALASFVLAMAPTPDEQTEQPINNDVENRMSL